MKLGLISSSPVGLLAAFAAAVLTACSGAPTPASLGGSQGDGGVGGGSDGGGGGPPPSPPHALGTIVLGESHASGSTSSVPMVLASFLPDAAILAKSCNKTIPGTSCTVAVTPTCDATTIGTCPTGQVCSLSATCAPTCTPACTLACATGEVCYFASPGSPACRKIETFDAGAIAFAGTTTPITLFPPYSYEPTGSGALFLAGAQIEVQGSGATGAGFAAFDEKFTATTFLQTSPSLSTLKQGDVFGGTGFSVGWQPGHDAILVALSGLGGTASCTASDSSGTFTVPSQVVTAIEGTGTEGTGAVTITVSRQRVEEKTDGKTQGTLLTQTVQPVGYLDLTTVSSESYTVQGCSGGETMCNGSCVDLFTSNLNCGKCGNSCGTSYCANGACYGTTCASPLTSCNGTCVNLKTSSTNCGSCGNTCAVGLACSGGACGGTGGCGTLTSCVDGCQNLQTSPTDCGSCGNACASGQSCISGLCSGSASTCSSCEATAESGGACSTVYTSCANDAQCGNYESCMSGCTAGDTVCTSSCYTSYPTGATEARNLQTCICTQQCPSSCASDSFCTHAL